MIHKTPLYFWHERACNFCAFSELEPFIEYFESWALSGGFYIHASRMGDAVLGSILLYGCLVQCHSWKHCIARSILFMVRFSCGSWNGNAWKDSWCHHAAGRSRRPSCRRAKGTCCLVCFWWRRAAVVWLSASFPYILTIPSTSWWITLGEDLLQCL